MKAQENLRLKKCFLFMGILAEKHHFNVNTFYLQKYPVLFVHSTEFTRDAPDTVFAGYPASRIFG
jgi:hypothetical protein